MGKVGGWLSMFSLTLGLMAVWFCLSTKRFKMINVLESPVLEISVFLKPGCARLPISWWKGDIVFFFFAKNDSLLLRDILRFRQPCVYGHLEGTHLSQRTCNRHEIVDPSFACCSLPLFSTLTWGSFLSPIVFFLSRGIAEENLYLPRRLQSDLRLALLSFYNGTWSS